MSKTKADVRIIKKPITKIINDYKSKLFPFTPRESYRYELRKLACQLEGLNQNRVRWTLDLEETHYCYIYMDPRYPAKYKGEYRYILPSGKILNLSHRPFYIGKGKGKRVYAHLYQIESSSKNRHKTNILRKLKRLGLKPIIKRTPHYDEYYCLAFEIDCIAGIGRFDKKLGPLTNKTDGGDGTSGYVRSKDTNRRQSISMLGKNTGPKSWVAASNILKFKGTPKTKQHRRRISAALKNVPKSHEAVEASKLAIKNLPKCQCPHCDFYGRKNDRWHFDNCKYK